MENKIQLEKEAKDMSSIQMDYHHHFTETTTTGYDSGTNLRVEVDCSNTSNFSNV